MWFDVVTPLLGFSYTTILYFNWKLSNQRARFVPHSQCTANYSMAEQEIVSSGVFSFVIINNNNINDNDNNNINDNDNNNNKYL